MVVFLTLGVTVDVCVGGTVCVTVEVGGMGDAVSVKTDVGGPDSVSIEERRVGDSRGAIVGSGVRVADGLSVFAG